ncbi:conserved domain protein [Hyphomonas neptunium ATCC 15444]|uniref:Conserved domain protein n=2 Tax=Hyphomonas TaxID=85 RepID=Q0C4L8_HYPNA|nr:MULTISPECIES: hypothetical protein [Hyphomonas]ABI78671.1 conserved domain protein [Hyphomonas neptunium ATCC 15444]KCZ96464.1 hypothetical protein HHI_02255 [Hyphomonas hirschiana VP5]
MTDTPDAPRPDPQPGPPAGPAPKPAPQPAPGPAPLPEAGPPAPAKRPLLKRLFGIGLWGSLKLLALCIVVGFFLMAANFDASEPSFNFVEALRAMLRQAFAALGWAIANFWQPALAGAVIVLPVWTLWRLASLPWRK